MIVIDLGCVEHGPEESIRRLIHRFQPATLYGFDPLLRSRAEIADRRSAADRLADGWPATTSVAGTEVVLDPRAAWVYDGELYLSRGASLDATVMSDSSRWMETTEIRVPCFDFPAWLRALDADRLVVKMDVEGAEFPLLEALHARRLDERIELLLVEWHDRFLPDRAPVRERLEAELRCPTEEWS